MPIKALITPLVGTGRGLAAVGAVALAIAVSEDGLRGAKEHVEVGARVDVLDKAEAVRVPGYGRPGQRMLVRR